ncbi:mechanosensitive ion channel family protein [Cellulophaga sp. Hel_I_12]|uniref:mechanosensitive ion channel family protein n=1 Tax=Cellulophaga sp. Hel_I_12 TaxID=1249972 RepID=UPI000647F890|nr:mechanosensitive ion channel domain-containing protein [Cellulophaga sp. Hel_I_12]
MNDTFGRLLYDYLVKIGINQDVVALLNSAIILTLALLLAWILDWIIWKFLRSFSIRLAKTTKSNFDNFLVSNRVPRALAHIIPLFVLFEFSPIIFFDFKYVGGLALKLLYVLTVILVLSIVKRILSAIKDYLRTLPHLKDKPLDSYIQVLMIFAWLGGILTIFAILSGSSVWQFFTALGAASAVILLIFKDSILGFVASIQVSINDMVRIGDWITFEKYGADGDVIEINLATVKVQNFDKTITTIPTYAMISDSFKNWRGMQNSGGRRIKRSLIIRQKSIRFLTEKDIVELKKIQLIASYLNTRSEQINKYNEQHEINKEVTINGRNLTNIGVFRKYIETYLENHSAINKKMTLMTRQLSPTPQGIPLEIYAFSADKRWENYEYVMADIFDHLLASLDYFDLEVFELPVSFEALNP